MFVNLEFKKWLRKVLTDVHYMKLDPNLDIGSFASHASETPAMRLLMKDFDLKKKHFTVGSFDCQIELPPPLENHSVPGYVDLGLLTIKKYS